jgi:hypothetical protein
VLIQNALEEILDELEEVLESKERSESVCVDYYHLCKAHGHKHTRRMKM